MFAGLLLFIPGLFANEVVEFCEESTVCVLEGSTVELSCLFKLDNVDLKEFNFFNKNNYKKWKDTTIPERLTDDDEYYGCVHDGSKGTPGSFSHSLFVSDLRQTDSGEYKLRINTLTSGWINSKYGTTIEVTGLKVRTNPDTVRKGHKVTLTCGTKCTLSDDFNNAVTWYKNGRQLANSRILIDSLYIDPFSTKDYGSYSCAVNDIHSSPLCLLDNCLDVRYTYKTICATVCSSVDLPCTYRYPSGQTVTNRLWSKTVDPSKKPELLEYGDDIQYRGDNETICTLRLKELRTSDAATYSFTFKAPLRKYIDADKVTLSVTDIEIRISPSVTTEGTVVLIDCHFSCILKRNTIIFYKDNAPPPIQSNSRSIERSPVSSDDAGIYSCALVGFENYRAIAATLVVNYPPRSTAVKVSKSQNTVLGSSSVILTCDSDANPPVVEYRYRYKWNGSDVSVLPEKNKSYRNPVISLKDIDQYICEARNQIGAQNSTWDLNEDDEQLSLLVPVLAVLSGLSVLTTGFLLMFVYYTLKRGQRGESALGADTQRVHWNRCGASDCVEIEGRDNIFADPGENVNIQGDTYTALRRDRVDSVYYTIPE